MFERDMKPPDRAPGHLTSRRLSNLVPDGVSFLLSSRRSTRLDHRYPSSWRQSQDSAMSGEYMTIKQKIMESSRDPPSSKSRKRSSSRISYLRNTSPRSSSSSEDSARSLSSDDVPYVDQPFRDGRRRKICHACYQPFGEHERVDICAGCCFERPAGCRECNWTGWARCAACVGHDPAAVGATPFATGFTRAPLVGGEGQRHRLRSWGLRQLSGTNTS